MKTLIIYYSLDGHTRWVADQIAGVVEGDLEEIKTAKKPPSTNLVRHFWGGRQVITRARPEILPLSKNPADYDFIFIGTPVWAFSFVPAFRTFFDQVKISDKKVALFLTCDGAPGKTFASLKKVLSGNEILGELALVSPFKDKTVSKERINNWLKEMI